MQNSKENYSPSLVFNCWLKHVSKFKGKHLHHTIVSDKVKGWKNIANFKRRYPCQSLIFNKIEGWKHNKNTKCQYAFIFYSAAFHLCSVSLLVTGKYHYLKWNCLHSASASYIGSCGQDLWSTQTQPRQGYLLQVHN